MPSDDIIRRKFSAGMSPLEVASCLHVPVKDIIVWKKQHGIHDPKPAMAVPEQDQMEIVSDDRSLICSGVITPECGQLIYKMSQLGCTDRYMASATGVSIKTIRRFREKNGIPTAAELKREYKQSIEPIFEELFSMKASVSQIAKALGVRYEWVLEWIKRTGCKGWVQETLSMEEIACRARTLCQDRGIIIGLFPPKRKRGKR